MTFIFFVTFILLNMYFICFTLFLLLQVHDLKTGSAVEYGYLLNEQKSWSNIYKDCGGTRQSPVIISSLKATPVALPNLELIDYHNLLPDQLNLVNNGHSVSLSVHADAETKSFIPYIFGAMLENNYIFSDMHFHWGARNNRGSEHIFNSIQYPLEMHLVHRNCKYNKIEEALKKRDGLVVLAVLFEIREKEHKPLNFIINNLKAITKYQSTTTINNSFELISLMPVDMDLFYLYTGSLTTPPCSEAVTWIVFPDPILISPKQINEFHMLKNSKNEALSDNFRIAQPTGRRKIYKRLPNKSPKEYKKFIDMLKVEFFQCQ